MGNAVYNDVKTEITVLARQSRSSQFVSGLGWVSENGIVCPCFPVQVGSRSAGIGSGRFAKTGNLGEKLAPNREKPEQDQDHVGPCLCPLSSITAQVAPPPSKST